LPVLLVPGFGQNRHTWEVGALSLPRYLAARGHPAYVLEYRGTGLARGWGDPPAASIALLADDVAAAADRLRDDCGAPRLVLVGHSLGGLTSLLYAAAHPERTAGVISLAGGFYLARCVPALRLGALLLRLLEPLGLSRRFAAAPLPLGVLGAALLAGRFWLDNPALPVLCPVWSPRAYSPEELFERFTAGMDHVSVGVTAEIRRSITNGGVPSRRDADCRGFLAGVRCPVLSIHAAGDALSPPPVGAPLPALLVNSPEALHEAVGLPPGPPFGHCDLVVSDAARRVVWPRLADWLSRLA
jgi:pimeloyl-ACP methyl ester carboxylesterase